jgi:hypothetical protein
MTDEELLLKNYEGQVYRYRNPNSQMFNQSINTVPASGALPSFLDPTQTQKTEEEVDANRVIVRS